ncbi:GxxExxY protein [Pedobacter suwonensis]
MKNYHSAQAKNFIVAYNFNVGLLINFGAISLQFKKICNPGMNIDQD